MKNKLLKLRMLLLFAVLLAFTNCQDEYEDGQGIMPQQTANGNAVLTGDEALRMRNELINQLKKNGQKGEQNLLKSFTASAGAELKTTYAEIAPYIDSTMVLLAIDSIHHKKNYTYRLRHPGTTDTKFYNLVLRKYNGYNRVTMITYEMESHFAETYYETGNFNNFTGKLTVEILSQEQGDPCEQEQNGGGGLWDGGANNGAVDTGYTPHSNYQIVWMQFQSLVYLSFYSQGQSNGGGYMNPNNENDMEVYSLSFNLSDATGPCDEDEVAVIDPLNDVVPDEKICAELKKFINTPNIKQSYIELQNHTEEYEEHGYGFKDGNTPPQALQLAPGSDETLQVPTGGTIYGASHTHIPSVAQANNPDKRAAPMFSLTDVMKLGELAITYTPAYGEVKNIKKVVFTLTIKGGENSVNQTYALKINDYWAFREYVVGYFALSDQGKKTKGQILHNKYIQRYANQGGESGYMTDFFNFLIDQNIKGISMYKANSDLSGWSKVDYNKASNTISLDPCPN